MSVSSYFSLGFFSSIFIILYIYIYGVFLVEFVFWGFDFHCAFWLVLNMEGFFFPLPTCRFQMGKKKKFLVSCLLAHSTKSSSFAYRGMGGVSSHARANLSTSSKVNMK